MEVVREGYKIPFIHQPPLSEIPICLSAYSANSAKRQGLLEQVDLLLQKGAIEPAPRDPPGFYSRLFVVAKASGEWRPIIDLSTLNHYIKQTSFKMETARSVLAAIRPGDWMFSLDLQDSYLQVPIHPASRKYLRFMFEDRPYQFKVLCFGLATAPQVFTRVMAPVLVLLHRLGIRILRFLDDWLVLASSREECLQARGVVIDLCHQLGIVIN